MKKTKILLALAGIALIALFSCFKTNFKPINSEIKANTGLTSIVSGTVIPDNQIRCYFKFENNGNDYKGFKTPTETSMTYTPGLIGQCAKFDGVNSFISYPPGQAFNQSSLIFNVCFWIKTTSTVSCYVFGASDALGTINTRSFYGRLDASGIYYAGIVKSNTLTEVNSGTVTVNDGNWHFISFKRDPSISKITLKIDDLLIVDQGYSSGLINASTYPLSIGKLGAYNSGGLFAGEIDEFGIFTGLTSAKETYLYNFGGGQTPPFN